MKKNILLAMLLLTNAFSHAQSIVNLKDVVKEQKANSPELVKLKGKLFTGTVVGQYPNGKPQSWTEITNGLPDGLWQEWYENGKLRFLASWREGKGEGGWQYYHENGVLRQDEFYRADIPTGLFSQFYNNGQLKQKGGYQNGKKHGAHEFYSESGMLLKRETYQDATLLDTKTF